MIAARHIAGGHGCVMRAHCEIHGVDETYVPGADYQCCGECGHVFRNEWNLVHAANLQLEAFARFEDVQFPRFTSGREIYTCPHCAHDF